MAGRDRETDLFSYYNQEFLIVVASGNTGHRGLLSPGSAKNALSVGSTGNTEDPGPAVDKQSPSSEAHTAGPSPRVLHVLPDGKELFWAKSLFCVCWILIGAFILTGSCHKVGKLFKKTLPNPLLMRQNATILATASSFSPCKTTLTLTSPVKRLTSSR